MSCDCETWAVEDTRQLMCGNGHHPKCQHFIPLVGAVDLLAALVKGISDWGANEDGIPDEVWEPYKKAVFITRGEILKD